MWSTRKKKKKTDHGLVMISGAYLHSTLSHFTQIWEAKDDTTSASLQQT